ncbi:MAG: hypothetical protein ACREFP_09120 [Acetobacteraceae bacterium]
MTGTEALALAAEHRVRVRLDGSTIRLAAPARPPEVVLDALRESKAEVVRLLTAETGPDLAALVEDTATRAHTATHPDLTPEEAAIEAQERDAIQGEAELPPQSIPHEELVAGLLKAARAEPREVGRLPDDPVVREHLASLSPGCFAAVTTNEAGRIEHYGRAEPEAPWLGPLPVRAPSFHATWHGWSAERQGWCTGCGQPSRWIADATPGTSGPRLRRWRCCRCFPQAPQ